DSASEGTVTAADLADRPLLRPAEVLEAVPGLIVTQHSGDGKANQYFLRGFNLDHGSDFTTTVLGMPVNMVSHAHGQGYMDLNFLIPELVREVKFRKGVYAVEDGDFSATGSARIDYQRQLPGFVEAGAGQNGYRRLLGAGSRDLGNGLTFLGAVETSGNNGPWEQPEQLGRNNVVLRLSSGSATDGFALSALAYEAHWTATEHVPERAIDSGEIGRYGSLLPDDGGRTHRYSLSGEWAATGNQFGTDTSTKASAYVIDYGLNLFSSPSGFINGPSGDQHEQADQRTVWGGQLSRSWFLGPRLKDTEITLGGQLRQDDIGKVGLYDTVLRQRTDTVREDRIRQTATAFYGEAKTQWSPWLRSSLGLRHDQIQADVTALGGTFNMGNGGSVTASQTSPKLGLVFGPFDSTEYYANWGQGFHSNDARGATSHTDPKTGAAIAAVPLMVRTQGEELGLRTTILPGWQSSLTLWRMALDSELVFIGDAGVTEPLGASRRHGLEWSNDLRLKGGFLLDADLAVSQARFREPVNGGNHVPNAIPLTASVALNYDNGGAWHGGLRLRYLGAYDLEETGTEKSTPFWMVNLRLGYRLDQRVQFTADILNLFNSRANDIEYWGGACTRNELNAGACGGGNGIDGRLVHPLEPRTLRLGVRIGF
ncbi:MAG: TonB-dependent receptor, partial [Betaproteobacteria bacterium]|nr:TonB-dependent receptor [Betaproteobacteria bacterium]